ncbi:GGDEF domain-containing protein [Roseateles depolymerans]|uniref:diguanylate cyclase n=1 Tax=Roseateles depolymerans TaxID=76731 RepID=A0A0U3CBY3_9BURK|nr:diguanylate cyclase [Roseateles depolymerans]ALV06248.1 Diguanylate cyclase (GGDEF) domain-containing protein [Roseateles depolymerans]REG19217.1 diguanylate cyclase [Roseateles depolymerans]
MPQQPPALIAKAALRRLALDKLEPTPENYARAYAQEAGEPARDNGALPDRAQAPISRLLSLAVPDLQVRTGLATQLKEGRWDELQRALEALQQTHGAGAQAEQMAQLIERLMKGLERGGRQWTLARKKDGVLRVLASNRTDPQRLMQRLRQLVGSWDSDTSDARVETQPAPLDDGLEDDDDRNGGTPSQFFTEDEVAAADSDAARYGELSSLLGAQGPGEARWPDIGTSLTGTVQHALRGEDPRAVDLVAELDAALAEIRQGGATPERAEAMEALCLRVRRWLDHRDHAFVELGKLCGALTESLADLAEDDSWARGQCEAMGQTLAQGLTARSVRSVNELLVNTRSRQASLREERSRARDALKGLINRMLQELGELGQHTDRFSDSVGRYAEVIEQADTLESLAGVVREMVEESRSVQSLVQQTQGRLRDEHDRASQLAERVEALEDELRKLSNEVQTDQLTQVANRRGLIATFETERAKLEREPRPLALALLDIDNFKKLNDSLGHAAGDEALKSLAARVSSMLRPGDKVGRWGGEEFVLILPEAPLEEAQAVLLRLQRSLSASLFMHEGRDVFVTFSAGVTLYRQGETLEHALDRADEALYEAKRTGKNRACVA